MTAFLWGALVAALAAGVFNTGAKSRSRPPPGVTTTRCSPRPCSRLRWWRRRKGLLVLLVWWFRRREFDGIIDGMVYAGVVAAGFAFTENIQYLGMAYDQAVTRRSPDVPRPLPVHPVRPPHVHGPDRHRHRDRRHDPPPRAEGLRTGRRIPPGGPVPRRVEPRSHHGRGGDAGRLPPRRGADLRAFVALVVWARRREGRLIGRHLRVRRRRMAVAERGPHALDHERASVRPGVGEDPGGRAMLRSMRRFQDSASELALLRARMHHSAADKRALETERDLLQTIR